jgi:hypothetical protein
MSDFITIGNLSEAEFFRWKLSLTEVFLAEAKGKLAQARVASMEKDVELVRLQIALAKHGLGDAQDSINGAKEAYRRFREEIKESKGFDLSDCVIDEITYEVRKEHS